MKKLKAKVLLGMLACTLTFTPMVSEVSEVSAAVSVHLSSKDPWKNTKKAVNYKICAVEGFVADESTKRVAFIPLYQDSNLQYHYDEKDSQKWHRHGPGTSCPQFYTTTRKKTNWLLQLNPWGVGDAGKGGVADGKIWIPESAVKKKKK